MDATTGGLWKINGNCAGKRENPRNPARFHISEWNGEENIAGR
jgi:hypothetical protein